MVLGSIQWNCWPKGSHENLQTTHSVAKTIVLPRFAKICRFAKDNTYTPIESRELELVPTRTLHILPSSMFVVARYSASHQKRSINTKAVKKLQTVWPARCTGTMMAQNLWEWPNNVWLHLGHTHWIETHTYTLVTSNHRLNSLDIWGETKHYCSKNKIKWLLVMACCTRRSVH